MGQLQSNCLAFCKELANDDGQDRLLARTKKVEDLRKLLEGGLASKAKTDCKYSTKIINIKKLSTEHAILEDDIEDDDSCDTDLSPSPSTKSSSN
jgi:hypothetical protein